MSRDFARGLMVSEMPLRNICRVSFMQTNAILCERYEFREVAACLELMLPGLDHLAGRKEWVYHPLGLPLALKCLDKLSLSSYFVGSILISLHCLLILTSPKPLGHGSRLHSVASVPSFMSVGSETIDVPCKERLFMHVKVLTELLFRWELNHKANVLMKLLCTLVPQGLLINAAQLITNNHSLHMAPRCTDCRQRLVFCVLCEEPVRGLGVFCWECGHGGHLLHMKVWFAAEQQCPAGCGCSCMNKFQSV